jgi:L-gulonolactone oxidase
MPGPQRFTNWSGTVSSTPTVWHRPASEGEIAAIVTRCAADGRSLRVIGSGHSFSAIAAPDDEAMSLEQMHGAVTIDRARNEVTVPGGMPLREVTAHLARAGLSLPIVGSIQAQTVAGAIATGTHGSSLVHGNLATLATSLRLVTGTGEVETIDAGDERVAGARVHLGALGVVTSVTLRTKPAVLLRQTIEHVPVDLVADRLDDIAGSAEWVKVWWLAHAPTAQVVRYETTTDRPTRRPSARTQRWIDERVMHRLVFPTMVALQHRRPQVTAPLNTWLSTRYLGSAAQVGPDMLMLNTPMPLRHRETEAAVPMTAAAEALERVLDIFRDGRPAVNFPLEIRFVRGDDGWLSPAHGADTCQIGAYTTDGPDCSTYFDRFWAAMRPMNARPHWGKELDHDHEQLRALYPRFDDFTALRARWDPQRVFAGGAHRRLLGIG